MKKIATTAAILMLLSTSFAFAQANPNGGVTTGAPDTEQSTQRQGAPGTPSNPGR